MTKFERACLQSLPADRIAKQLNCPVEAVVAVKWKWRLKREQAYRERKKAQERAIRVPKEEGSHFIDREEMTRQDRDRASMETWCRMPLKYGNHPDSVRGLDGSRYVRDLRKLPLTGFRVGVGLSTIYEQLGTDMRAAA